MSFSGRSILFTVFSDRLSIKTTNLDTYISSEIEINSGEDGLVCIPVMKLNEILSALPECELNFSVSSNGKITINNNIGNYTIMSHNPEEFPSEPILDSVNSINFDSTKFELPSVAKIQDICFVLTLLYKSLKFFPL